MIGRLRGELVEIEGSMALVEVGGVAYEVTVPDLVLARMPAPGEPVELRVRQIVREDGVTLYGFLEPFQRRLFDLLLGVNGCGPKASLALIGQVGEDVVAAAILAGDSRTLTRATGVGTKLAERILLELKEKIAEEAMLRKIESAVTQQRRSAVSDELVDALIALGYRRSDAEKAAEEAREGADGVEAQIRHALRLLQR